MSHGALQTRLRPVTCAHISLRFTDITIFEETNTMTQQDLLAIIEEGVENGRIPAHLAAYIAAEVMGVEASATGYDERVRLEETSD